VAHGDPPYAASFENKPVGIFLLYRLSLALFGVSLWPMRILALVANGGTMFALYAIGKRYRSPRGGAMAALVFALFAANRLFGGQRLVWTETFMLPCTALAVYLLATLHVAPPDKNRWMYLVGIGMCFGAAAGFKQVAVVDAVGLIPFFLLAVANNPSGRTFFRDAFGVLLGSVAITALELLPLAMSGVSVHDYWQAVGRSLLARQSETGAASAQVRAFVETWTASALVICLPLLVLYFFQRKRLRESGVPYWSLLFWLGMAFLGANSSADVSGHQLKLMTLPFALIAGLAIESFAASLGRVDSARVLAWFYVSLVAVLLPYDAMIVEFGDLVLKGGVPRPGKTALHTARAAAEYIKSQTAPSDYIYIWHPGPEYWLAQRPCASRYFNHYFHFMPDFETRMAGDFAAHPPVLILVNEQSWIPRPSFFAPLLAKEYVPVCRIDQYQVFRRAVSPKPD
jgi:4-amino-4-deoxy-L-arabinose transferase-like glycosyltransferase